MAQEKTRRRILELVEYGPALREHDRDRKRSIPPPQHAWNGFLQICCSMKSFNLLNHESIEQTRTDNWLVRQRDKMSRSRRNKCHMAEEAVFLSERHSPHFDRRRYGENFT
ncbi:hypothetical protein CEXT_721251 [Caerostris extrusa]|uniref:Uncharacterized protein n=1 Tax=Caerostris extrusa TaxID=172846 RepID=A0AAV4Q908_CAEEX|nr:hypothetical protein CEXT_721251 [Caerostris extrusa]